MSDATTTGPVLAADGTPLKKSLSKALRRQKIRALMLIAPLLLFVTVTFILPIGDMLFRSVENEIVSNILPRTVVELDSWDSTSGDLPDEAVYAALAADLLIAVENRTHIKVGIRLNYELSGMTSLFKKTGRVVDDFDPDLTFAEQFIDIRDDWGEVETWQTIQMYSSVYTNGYFVSAIDMRKGPDGLERLPDGQRVYITSMIRTLVMTLAITLLCLIIGYPVAWLLANLPMAKANLLMILVLLPFWTSLLVRTSAWKVLLQKQGVINDVLVWIGIISDDSRLAMINNQAGTIITMTHILLPFMILPLYSVMKGIPPTYLRAAKSLGATNWTAFWRVYFPQSVPGIGAGAILVFILSVGYYITPELVGGPSGKFLSNWIAEFVLARPNWGLAAALGAILLGLVMFLYVLYDKIVGIDNVKLG
ncbi:MAG: ABC transporter permease [Rhodobacteraceae bacterium]|nr:ABC transporter permease [Paracoccaceae bacterium]